MFRSIWNWIPSFYERFLKEPDNLEFGGVCEADLKVCRIEVHQAEHGALFIDPKAEMNDFPPENFNQLIKKLKNEKRSAYLKKGINYV